jgi:pyrimidine-nucleoside phosphorylase
VHIPSLIEKKRDGGQLDPAEIAELIAGYSSGGVPDYQMAAFAMAVYFRGMSDAETSALTSSMRDSGDVFRWPAGSPPKVDKHSTGGIGDKVSLVLAPLLACDGLWVPMVSGRGLGITGGTLDKLESIPGFNVRLDASACLRQIEKIGVFMAGQTGRFCPADRRLYALRDVTATVPSRPLIIASIMSKKLAESLDRLVLDVKFGTGAFMKSHDDARRLADGLVAAGRANGVRTTCILTPMDEPLGRTVGNALEVAEAVDALQGRGPDDLVALTLDLACAVSDSPRDLHARRLADGSAWKKFLEIVEAQSGDARSLDRPPPAAPVVVALPSPRDGVVQSLDAGALGAAAVRLGAGRNTAADGINPSVGFSHIKKSGERVAKGEPILMIHAASGADATLAARAIRFVVD